MHIEKVQIFTYHSLYVNNSCALINVFLCSDRAGWELIIKGPLEFLNMIFNISVQCCGLHEFVSINFTQSFYINWSSLLINSMMTLGIILKDLISFFELIILTRVLIYNS